MSIEQVVSSLIIYGPLGIFCGLFAVAVVWKDRQMMALQKQFLDKQEALMAAHKQEMTVLQDRYISKAETWMDKYRERAEALQTLVEAMAKK